MAAMLLSFFATSTVLAAGTVSGTVYQSNGTTPVTDTSVQIKVYCGDPCGSTTLIKSANTNSADGTYSIPGLPAGTYFLQSENNAGYLDEWWSFPSSSGICPNAAAVTVTEGETTTDTNFQLDLAATISGTVYQSDGATPITGGGSVTAYTGDPCGTHSWITSASINTTDGTYTINGLPSGTYYLQVDAYSNYVREWWADPSSVVECSGAMPIAITAGDVFTGKNFQLDIGATISGTVYQSDGVTPIVGGGYVGVVTGDPCGSYSQAGSDYISSDGTYSIESPLTAGTYYLRAIPYSGSEYSPEWWADPSSVVECSGAMPIAITAGGVFTGKNFQLDIGATISGTVYQSDGVTPIVGGGYVDVVTGDPCGTYDTVQSATINSSTGEYESVGLAPGTYYLLSSATGGITGYVSEWWALSESTESCSGAQSIPVTAGEAVTGKTFQLDSAAAISGTVYQSDGATPITGGGSVTAYTGDPCGTHSWIASASINPTDGTYTINNLPAGTYYLQSNAYSDYTSEWWADPSSVVDCSGAQSIAVTAGNTVTGKNFQLNTVASTPASISGTAYQSDGVTPIPGGGSVVAYTGDPCGSYSWAGSASINPTDGTYTINNLSTGTYYLQLEATCNYAAEWWADPSSVVECSGAQSISVTSGGAVAGKNFQLGAGTTISGTVYQNDGTTPITGGGAVYAYTGDPCGSHSWAGYAYINTTNGTYMFMGLPAGTYYLNSYASNYINEWWADPSSVVECSGAQSIAVPAGDTVTGKNFQLDPAATISGTVYQNDGTTPITGGGSVTAYTGDPCGSYSSAGYGSIDSTDGTYSINGLPTGTFYLKAQSYSNYVREWWADPSSVVECSGAQSIAVAAEGAVSGKNFQLEPAATISGTVYQNDGATPITDGGYVYAYTGDPCGSHSLAGSAFIDSTDGTYSINGLPAGTFYLKAWSVSNYVHEWWANPLSVADCSGAQSIAVAAEGAVAGKNFQLDPGAMISGTVYQSDGTTPITNGGYVYAYTGDPCASHSWAGTASINTTDGTYMFMGLPAGTYYLYSNTSNYINEWWADPSSVVECNGAMPISVPAGDTVPNTNFQLDSGSTGITGTVTSDTNGQPVAGVTICGDPFPSGHGGSCTTTQSDGTYTLHGILSGYTRVTASGAGYLKEYYDNTYDYNWATAVWAPAEQTTSNINFSMGNFGSISGTVAQSNPAIPLANVCVDAYRHLCATNPFASAMTDSSGRYTITNLPPQAYYVKIGSPCTHPLHYDDVWWQGNTSGEMFCDQAGAVNVTSGQNTNAIDFNLLPSEATYPGPSFRSAGLFSSHNADESITTTFYAFIDGPSPEDVASFTATGPSGTFNLSLNQTPFIQLGNIYTTGSASVVDDGTYTFLVTDSLGRTATVARIFVYNSTVPQVDSATMKVDAMGNQSYVGTATPTLSWDAVSWPGTPGYYQVFIYDYDGKAVWYNEVTDGTSITVPEGYLQPDTAYRWWVRTGDKPEVGQKGQNRRYSDTLYFYMGTKGLPDLTKRNILSYSSPDNAWANWFGISQTKLAPWDIGRYYITGPNGTVYPYANRLYLVWHPMFYYAWSPGPAPMPDGTYRYGLEDTDLNKDIQTTAFAYNSATPVSEATRSPAPNAYLYTKTPTFSWDPPDRNGTYYYNLRIHDYNRRIHWYSYSTTETSVTLPSTLDGPPGSYKWVVRAYTDPEHTNGAFSSVRTFTIPPLSDTSYTLPKGVANVRSYRLFTVPYYMSGTNFLNVMEAVLGTYDPTHWRVFALVNGFNIEVTSSDFASLSLVPGMGFWIITLYDNTVQFEGALCPQNTSYTRSLPAGWQAISLPWSEGSVNLGDITVSNGTTTYHLTDDGNTLTQSVIWEYTGDGPELYNYYEKRSDPNYPLVNGTGYLLEVLAPNVTVTIPPPSEAGAESRKIASVPGRSGIDTTEPPPAFLCKLGQNNRASSGRNLLPLPPGGRVTRPDCSDCSGNNGVLRLKNVEFDSETPCLCMATEQIIVGENVKVKDGADVIFQAPIINLNSGFHAEPGAVVTINQE